MDLSGYTLAMLHQDTEFVLCRASAMASPTPYPTSVLVSMPTSEHPAPDRIRMLEHELALRAELDPTPSSPPISDASSGSNVRSGSIGWTPRPIPRSNGICPPERAILFLLVTSERTVRGLTGA